MSYVDYCYGSGVYYKNGKKEIEDNESVMKSQTKNSHLKHIYKEFLNFQYWVKKGRHKIVFICI